MRSTSVQIAFWLYSSSGQYGLAGPATGCTRVFDWRNASTRTRVFEKQRDGGTRPSAPIFVPVPWQREGAKVMLGERAMNEAARMRDVQLLHQPPLASPMRDPQGWPKGGRHSTHEAKLVDPALAAKVGEWYLGCRSAHGDRKVQEAYRQLQIETDRLFAIVSRHPVSSRARVVFTRCPLPYASDTELIAAVSAGGTLEVTSAATPESRLHPLLDCEFGGAFDRFRAVHDLIGHAWSGYGFALGDECAAWRVQDLLHRGLARGALATELFGVNAARSIIGESSGLKALVLPIREGHPDIGR
jgi:hypothetical protein